MKDQEFGMPGYHEEDAYFRERDAKLVERLKTKRAELNVTRRRMAADAGASQHWMKCPKCGGQMQEVELEGIMVDRCGDCDGIYFDKGEVEMLLAAHSHEGVLARLRRALHIG